MKLWVNSPTPFNWQRMAHLVCWTRRKPQESAVVDRRFLVPRIMEWGNEGYTIPSSTLKTFQKKKDGPNVASNTTLFQVFVDRNKWPLISGNFLCNSSGSSPQLLEIRCRTGSRRGPWDCDSLPVLPPRPGGSSWWDVEFQWVTSSTWWLWIQVDPRCPVS